MKELNLGTENIGSLILLRDVVIFVQSEIKKCERLIDK